MAAIGMVAGGVLSYMAADKQASAAGNGGKVDITRTSNPYGQASQYLDAGAAAAYRALYGAQPGLLSDRNPNTPYTVPNQAFVPGSASGHDGAAFTPNNGGGGGQQGIPDDTDPFARSAAQAPMSDADAKAAWRRQRAAAAKTSAVAGKGSTPGAPGPPLPPSTTSVKGQSGSTSQAINDAARVAKGMEGSDVVRAAQDYTTGTLRGQDQNGYRGEAADYLRNVNDNPDYRRYLDSLFASDTGLPGGGSSAVGGGQGGYGGGGSYGASSGIGFADTSGGTTGAAQAVKDILAGKETPGAQAMRDRIKHQADEGYAQQVQQRKLAASGSGMYGGTGQLADEAYSEGKYGAGLADAYAQQDYQLYEQALNGGLAYDTAALDRAQRAQASAYSAGGQAASLASQERMDRLNALGSAIGMGVNNRQFQASGMGTLAGTFSADQQNAANHAGDINGLNQQGYLAAGGLSLGSDQAQNAWQSSENQLKAAQGANSVARGRLEFDKNQWATQLPMMQVGQYANIINGLYGPYSSTHETGTDQRSSSPSTVNPVMQGLSGAAAGYQLGSNWG